MESEVRPTHRGGAGLATAPAPGGPPPSAPVATGWGGADGWGASGAAVAEVDRLLPRVKFAGDVALPGHQQHVVEGEGVAGELDPREEAFDLGDRLGRRG
ncbi:MAG TPA: hypothetical protein VNK05_18345, partial [Chloroflexota bacterium]|nr:hypothetical protein [Chloroflexota bacterium]